MLLIESTIKKMLLTYNEQCTLTSEGGMASSSSQGYFNALFAPICNEIEPAGHKS